MHFIHLIIPTLSLLWLFPHIWYIIRSYRVPWSLTSSADFCWLALCDYQFVVNGLTGVFYATNHFLTFANWWNICILHCLITQGVAFIHNTAAYGKLVTTQTWNICTSNFVYAFIFPLMLQWGTFNHIEKPCSQCLLNLVPLNAINK